MIKTNLQKQIEHNAHMKTVFSNSTILASKQALYNRIFKADNFTKYKPNMKESKFELLVAYNVHIAITRHLLKNLSSRGNMSALELLNNINHTVSIEDLEQEVLLKFVELSDNWSISFNGDVSFNNDDTMKEVFGCISSYLYKFQTKHFKHQYISIDTGLNDDNGNAIFEIIDATKVSQLSKHISIADVVENTHFYTFYNAQTDNDKKWIMYRVQGLSNSKIAATMGVTNKHKK